MIVIMIPNVIFSIKNKNHFLNTYSKKSILILEQVGRYGCFTLMCVNIPYFYIGYWFKNAELIYISVNIFLLVAYCTCWIIFWNKNNIAKALFLSILPSLMFLLSGIVTFYIPLIIFALIFAYCHILISYKNIVLG